MAKKQIMTNLKKVLFRKEVYIFCALFAFVGIAFLINSRAATNSTSSEAESGTVATPALKISDTTASGGSLVQFNQSATPPPPAAGILFGSNRHDESDTKTTQAEAALGRQFDVIRLFNSSMPSNPDTEISFSKELSYANKGYVVHTSWNIQNGWGTWKAISDELRTVGSKKRQRIENLATNMQRDMPGPFIVTVQHEPEASGKFNATAGSGNTGQDYGDMVCAIYELFKTKGATKAKFSTVAVPIPHYWSNNSRGAEIYPGDQCTDFNGVDPYNFFTDENPSNWLTIEQVTMNKNPDGTQKGGQTGWYQWATRDFTGVACTVTNNPVCKGNVRKLNGATEPKQAKGNKPLLVAEWSSSEYYPCVSPNCNTPHTAAQTAAAPAAKGNWYRQALIDFRDKMPRFKVIQHWGFLGVSGAETNAHCFGNDFRFDTILPSSTSCSTSLSAVGNSYTGNTFVGFKEITLNDYFYTTKGLSDGSATSAAAQKRFQFINSLFP
ncbi:MAG: hypothetical protein AAB459_01105 [Patescibacteria group bacterium]